MTSVEFERLFEINRLPTGPALLPILLYSPIGILLAVIRIFIGIHAFLISCILPKTSSMRWPIFRRLVAILETSSIKLTISFILRVMCGVLGIVVTQHNVDNKATRRANIIVSNYCSTLDHLAIELVQPNVMISVWDLPTMVMWLMGYKDLGALQGQDTLINNIHRHCSQSDIPLLAFPEGSTTNGNRGLLKFSSWPFSVDRPVQPIVIQISRPLCSVAPSILGSQWWADIFWFLFVPISIIHLRFLETVKQSEDENAQEFARRVQTMMACALGVEPTTYTSADKTDLVKRLSAASASSHRESADSGVSEVMDMMVNQVKIVLPHVPVHAIRKDLELTKDTDLTITNILEGRVVFDPTEPGIEAERTINPSPSRTNSATRKPPVSSTASATFGKSSTERQASFQERKQKMIESARKRYLEKHPSLENVARTVSSQH